MYTRNQNSGEANQNSNSFYAYTNTNFPYNQFSRTNSLEDFDFHISQLSRLSDDQRSMQHAFPNQNAQQEMSSRRKSHSHFSAEEAGEAAQSKQPRQNLQKGQIQLLFSQLEIMFGDRMGAFSTDQIALLASLWGTNEESQTRIPNAFVSQAQEESQREVESTFLAHSLTSKIVKGNLDLLERKLGMLNKRLAEDVEELQQKLEDNKKSRVQSRKQSQNKSQKKSRKQRPRSLTLKMMRENEWTIDWLEKHLENLKQENKGLQIKLVQIQRKTIKIPLGK